MKVVYGLKELEVLVRNFFYVLLRLLVHGVNHTFKKHRPRETFFRNHERNSVPYLFAKHAIYFPSGKNKLSSHSFLKYCYTQSFLRAIYRALQMSQRGLVHDKNVHKFFQPCTWQECVSNLSIVITQYFQYPFLVKYYFSIKHFL